MSTAAAENVTDLTDARRAAGLQDNGDPPDLEPDAPDEEDVDEGGASIRERARRGGASVEPQESLFDRIIDDPELEKVLDEREKLNAKRLQSKKAFEVKRDEAKGKIDALGLEEGEVIRVGRYKVKRGVAGEPKDVSFTTSPSPRITITLLD